MGKVKHHERVSRWERFFASIICDMPHDEAHRLRAMLGMNLTAINNEIQAVVKGGVYPLAESSQPYVTFLMRKRDSMKRIHVQLCSREIFTRPIEPPQSPEEEFSAFST